MAARLFISLLLYCYLTQSLAASQPRFTNVTRLYVDQSGQRLGSFKTVQSAIDAVPEDNKNWVIIHVKEGIYWEQVIIDYTKPFIVLKGKGRKKTEIVNDLHQALDTSPTFISRADNIVVKSITFRNSFNEFRTPAAAALIYGDNCFFYRVGFYGWQDTLWDSRGRHYFQKCTIQGAVDFIFGNGISIYEKCVISVLGDRSYPGFITAHGRERPDEPSGFVFKNCRVDGPGTAMLGRPWRTYARVLFTGSYFSDAVVAPGWNAWNTTGQEEKITFEARDCYGPGANKTGWVSWEVKQSPQVVRDLTSMDFIKASTWLYSSPTL